MATEYKKELTTLFISIFNSEPWNNHWTKETAQKSLDELIHMPGFFGLYAYRDSKILGAIMGHVHHYDRQKTYYIDEFFVANEYKRQGIGKKLYTQAINELMNEGVAGAFFTTLKNTPAYHFYLEMGAIDLTDSSVMYHPFKNQ